MRLRALQRYLTDMSPVPLQAPKQKNNLWEKPLFDNEVEFWVR